MAADHPAKRKQRPEFNSDSYDDATIEGFKEYFRLEGSDPLFKYIKRNRVYRSDN